MVEFKGEIESPKILVALDSRKSNASQNSEDTFSPSGRIRAFSAASSFRPLQDEEEPLELPFVLTLNVSGSLFTTTLVSIFFFMHLMLFCNRRLSENTRIHSFQPCFPAVSRLSKTVMVIFSSIVLRILSRLFLTFYSFDFCVCCCFLHCFGLS
jgi:hypothetical protein